jgi:hypothetical protein
MTNGVTGLFTAVASTPSSPGTDFNLPVMANST